MGFNQRRMARERAAAERAERERGQRELGRDRVQAEKLVAVWNSRAARKARPSFYPTIETALLAGAPWLAYQCPSCQLIGDVHLRTLHRHGDGLSFRPSDPRRRSRRGGAREPGPTVQRARKNGSQIARVRTSCPRGRPGRQPSPYGPKGYAARSASAFAACRRSA